jgi:hypothetical protein
MTPEILFLDTIDDLDNRLELGRGEYDALCMAWLLRKTLCGGRRSLVSLIDPDDELSLTFTVWDWEVSSTAHGFLPLVPTVDTYPTVDLGLKDFLRRPCVVVWEENDVSRRHLVSVERLIRFLADNWGAVHLSRPDEGFETALWDFCWSQDVQTAHGQYTGGVFCLTEVAKAARAGLEPLRAHLEQTVTYVERKTGKSRRTPPAHAREPLLAAE